MRIAVVGATGNVGQALLPELQRAGHETVGVARRIPDHGAGADEWHRADMTRNDLTPLDGRSSLTKSELADAAAAALEAAASTVPETAAA